MERFWDFSVRTYRTDGVPAACLSLQNEHGADVNMLLFCAWVASVAGSFPDDLFERAADFSTRWAGHVVIPLRETRTWMKLEGCAAEPVPADDCMHLREDVKQVEFAAEKMQQEVLESMVTAAAREPGAERLAADVATNLARYCASIDIPATDDVAERLSIIVRAAFPDLDESGFRELIRG